MSHPGNDEKIDNERDNKVELSQKLVLEMTRFGIEVVQHMATEALRQKPGMSTKEFMKVLDQFIEKQEELLRNITSK
jgi:hypothetical protein